MIAESTTSRTPFMKGVLLFVLFVAVFTGVSYYVVKQEEHHYDGKMYPAVSINGINVGSMPVGQVRSLFDKKNRQLNGINIQVLYQGAPIATFSAAKLGLQYDTKGIIDRAYLIGRSSRLTSRFYQQFLTIMNLRKFDFEVTPQYDTDFVTERLSTLEDTYNHDAKNALFKFDNGRVIQFRPEEKGLSLESSRFLSDITSTINGLNKKIESRQVILKSQVINPQVTLAQANNFGVEEFIAQGQSNYTHSIPERVHNVLLAASKFDGVLIPKGATFSFNDIVGDISALTGYQPAYVIKDGHTVLGDGGGVCQVSTTMFRAALNAGLPITERFAHAYRVEYYENDSGPGFDATVFAPYADLKFVNDTPASILIETTVDKDNNILTFKFYGKRDGRKVEISKANVYDIQAPPPALYQDDPTLKKGVVKQTDFAAWGAKADFTYKVTRADNTIYQKDFFSLYQPWQAVYLVGQAD